MKALLVLLGILIAGAALALGFHAVRQQNARIAVGLTATHAEELHKRYLAELESDRLERDTEQLLWDAPLGLAQQRLLIAQELTNDLAGEPQSSAKDNSPDPGIALERVELARIDARLLELKNKALTRRDQNAYP